MTKATPAVPIAVRASVDFRQRAQIKAKKEGTSIQAVVTAFLQRWLDEEPAAKSTAAERHGEPREPKEHRRSHELLQFILENGSSKDIDWITGNLVNFGEAIRARAGKPEGQRKAS